MGMVKMKHINIYGPEQDPQQTLEVLAKLACFHPDKDAERINAAAGAAENLYTPLLASTLGLIKDVGGDPALQEYRGRFFEYGAVKDEVEALSAQVAERGKRQARRGSCQGHAHGGPRAELLHAPHVHDPAKRRDLHPLHGQAQGARAERMAPLVHEHAAQARPQIGGLPQQQAEGCQGDQPGRKADAAHCSQSSGATGVSPSSTCTRIWLASPACAGTPTLWPSCTRSPAATRTPLSGSATPVKPLS